LYKQKIIELFKARADIFALRWEKGNKSGYMPAVNVDPYRLKMHKIHGGTFKDYKDKEYRPLTEKEIERHLSGEQFIGIYPLLKDNTSWFIAADFDEKSWTEQCRLFIKICEENRIPAYLERSRSGNGGHVWIFFDKPYPAVRSRKIVITLLQQLDIFSVFDKSSSFDRLFPNQDMLSGKGFGNLIALPFNKTAMENGNCCFINPETLVPYPDQHTFINVIKRLSSPELDELYSIYSKINVSQIAAKSAVDYGKTFICLNENVLLNKNSLPITLINFLKDELNFANTEFFIRKNLGKSTHETKRFFKLIQESENDLIIPRGFIGRIIKFCKENKIDFEFNDERKKLPEIKFASNISLYAHQELAYEAAKKKDFGVIVAPPGTGKTVIGLKIIAEKHQPALILVHRKQLADQWIERIQTFLGIPKHLIGIIGQGKKKVGKFITVAMIQSLSKELEKNESSELINSFGTIIVDECHHIPAETYKSTVSKLHAYYLYGLTATPFRKYNDGKLIFINLGEIISEVKPQEVIGNNKATIIIRNTELDIPFNSKTDKFETLSKVLGHDTARNKLILNDVISEINAGKRAVIITERKEHIETLYQYLKHNYEAITLSGDDIESSRNNKWKTLNEGNYQVLITTGQYFGEGTDLKNAECLFLAYPFSFEGKLIQYIGRVQRSEVPPTIYDYRDYKIDYLNKLFLKRNTYYRKLERLATLFDESGIEITTTEKTFKLEQRIKIPIEQIEFRYGSIAFKYVLENMNTILEFEIENNEVRPEFDVLKPYFTKILKTNSVEVEISAEFNDRTLISQLAVSKELEKINREIIDSVRFRFVSKNYFGKVLLKDKNIIDLSELQTVNGSDCSLYESETELLEDILKKKQVKHYRQLRFLSEKHEGAILKIRFVLSPFSFVFLLSGEDQFHIILETMDTEEATYIWHIEKSISQLKYRLREIDNDLNIVRNKGRQAFLDTQPQNFSRVLHDYSDEKKGFIIWKDLLEERLA
jgi:superfamily II DNA or RNA helicase